jgi:hypothetical protein
MSRYTPLLLACLLLARPSQSFSDPTFIGSKYLISSEATGDYLTCGTDTLCSMQPLSGAHETDGWTMLSTDSYWQFIGNDGSWALDVQNSVQSFQQQTGEKVFANTETDVEPNLDQGQLWSLIPWPDGSYQLQNIGWSNGALDVDEGVTPFVNTVNSDSSLTGQYWYFLSVQPQVTTTVFTTSTQTVNTLAATTVTVTTTVCPNKVRIPSLSLSKENRFLTWWGLQRAHVNGTPLYKRQATGSAILDTTTTTVTSTITSTTTQIGATILTSTEYVPSLGPNLLSNVFLYSPQRSPYQLNSFPAPKSLPSHTNSQPLTP